MLKSGLTYEQVQGVIAAAAVETIENAKGGLRKNGGRVQVYFNYQAPDPTKATGKRQVRLTRQTTIDARELAKRSYAPGGINRRRLVNAFRADILADVKTIRGVQADPTATVGDVCAAFIDYKQQMGAATGVTGHGRGIRDTTAASMRRQLKRLSRFSIYDMPLNEVTPVQVQKVVNEMCETHSGASVQGTISILRQACRWCLGSRADLPTDGVVLPRVSHKAGKAQDAGEDGEPVPRGRKNILTRSEIPGVVRMCADMTGTLRTTGTAAIIGLCCGLRVGEVSALQWKDVHLDADQPYVSVRHSLNVTNDAEGHTLYSVGKTKSRASRRNVAIPASVVPILRRRRAEVLEALLALDVAEGEAKPSAGELFVCGDLTGEFRSVNALSCSWRTYCKRHDIHGTMGEPLSFHQLRDSYASALIDDGVPVLRVSHMLGHETIDVTIRRYVFGNDRDAFESVANHSDIFAPRDDTGEQRERLRW